MPSKPTPARWLRIAGLTALLVTLGMILGQYLSRH
jgi:hypothetical protein